MKTMLDIIASEAKTPVEFARRAEAWAASESTPPSDDDICNAFRLHGTIDAKRLLCDVGTPMFDLVEQARAERLVAREHNWQRLIGDKRKGPRSASRSSTVATSRKRGAK